MELQGGKNTHCRSPASAWAATPCGAQKTDLQEENKMKKWLSLILVAVLTLSLLAGCAAKTTDQPAASTDTAADTTPADTAATL